MLCDSQAKFRKVTWLSPGCLLGQEPWEPWVNEHSASAATRRGPHCRDHMEKSTEKHKHRGASAVSPDEAAAREWRLWWWQWLHLTPDYNLTSIFQRPKIHDRAAPKLPAYKRCERGRHLVQWWTNIARSIANPSQSAWGRETQLCPTHVHPGRQRVMVPAAGSLTTIQQVWTELRAAAWVGGRCCRP